MSEASAGRSRPRAAAGAAAQPRQASLTLLLFLVLLAAAAAPIFSVRIPALIDYPNHLGRIHTMAVLGRDPYLSAFYSVHWKIIPNLGVDLLLPLFARHFDVYLVGRIFIFVCLALTAAGVLALHYAVYRRLSPAPLAVFLVLYNFIVFYGFLNYLLGIGIALWGIAAWLALRPAHGLVRGIVSLAFILILFACHLFAAGIYGLAVLADEIRWLREEGRGEDRRRRGREAAVFAIPFLAVPALLLSSPTTAYSLAIKWAPEAKFFGLYYSIKNFNNPLDLGIGLVLAGAAFVAWRRGILRFHPLAGYLLAVSLPVYIIMPDVLLGSWAADRRLPIAILYIVIALAQWRLATTALRAGFIAGVAGISLLRFAVVAYYWQWYDHLFAEIEQSARLIAPGSRILVGQLEDPPLRYTFRHFLVHAPCLAMIERSSLVPTAFTHPGKQILQINPAFQQDSDVLETPLPVQAALVEEARHPDPAPRFGKYWAGWPGKFDYLYVMYQRRPDNPLPGLLAPLYQGEEFSLYRIARR